MEDKCKIKSRHIRELVELRREKPLEISSILHGLRIKSKKGEHVLFGKYAGNEIKIDGVEYLIMREDDILGIIEK